MSQFSLSWDSYKSNICNGFSALQQSGEFVDMTIAADGHLVKVHQVLVALASPYLKDLIASAPCPHPVVYLNNISHKVLCYILEYIYTGEVIVPSESLHAFTAAAKSLFIRGLEGINDYGDQREKVNTTADLNDTNNSNTSGTKRKISIDITNQLSLPPTARKVTVKTEGGMPISQPVLDTMNTSDTLPDLEEPTTRDSDEEYKMEAENESSSDKLKATTSSLLFTVSIRGALQLILNRYIYNLNSTVKGLRKWRCVDYRNIKCTAFVVTKGNVVVNRANPHNHAFHDKKILSKIEKKSVFSAIDDVEAYRDNRKEMEQEATVTQDELSYDRSYDNSITKNDSE